MKKHAPTSREGYMAWQLGQRETLWQWLPIIAAQGSVLVLQGFDHSAAISQALAQAPDLDVNILSLCLEGLEAGRRKAERDMQPKGRS